MLPFLTNIQICIFKQLLSISINEHCQLKPTIDSQSNIIMSDKISLNKSDQLELGEIPSTHPEPKPVVWPNTPLGRLFFDPDTMTYNIPPIPPPAQVSPKSQQNRTDSSHSNPDSQGGKGAGRSRSRDRRKTNTVLDDEKPEGLRRRNRRLPKQKKQQGGPNKKDNGSNSSEDNASSSSNAKILIIDVEQQLKQNAQYNMVIKQDKEAILEVKQCHQGLFYEKNQERSGVKLNNSNFDKFFKTRLCPQFQAGHCERNMRCTFAHGQKQLRISENSSPRPASYKTKTCNNFDRGVCPKKKEDCNYAHGKEDLRCASEKIQKLEKNQANSSKKQTQNVSRNVGNNQKLYRRKQQCPSTSASRQLSKNQSQKTKSNQNSKTKSSSKTQKDLNQKYNLTERQKSQQHLTNHQSMHIYDYHQQATTYGNGVDSSQYAAYNKNMMGNNYYGGYYPPGMPYAHGQSQMHGYSANAVPEGYPNVYYPMYPYYPQMQHQMSFYPPYANFPPSANSSAFNGLRPNFDYMSTLITVNGVPEGNVHSGRGDKQQNSRHRAPRAEHQHSNHQ